jgi:hypothetical protein
VKIYRRRKKLFFEILFSVCLFFFVFHGGCLTFNINPHTNTNAHFVVIKTPFVLPTWSRALLWRVFIFASYIRFSLSLTHTCTCSRSSASFRKWCHLSRTKIVDQLNNTHSIGLEETKKALGQIQWRKHHLWKKLFLTEKVLKVIDLKKSKERKSCLKQKDKKEEKQQINKVESEKIFFNLQLHKVTIFTIVWWIEPICSDQKNVY